MVTVTTNIQAVVNELKGKLLSIADKNNVIRTVAATLAPEVRKRIHVNGLAANGGPIGQYSLKYWKYRRPKFNRTEPRSKVVASLTRTMENQFTSGANNPNPTKTALGYGLGFINTKYRDIAGYLEETYKKKIWALTEKEKKLAIDVARGEVKKILTKR